MALASRTIVLMGLRGSGKSTIGPTVSIRLGLPFKDLDPLALAWGGAKNVRDVVSNRGWPAFREMERDALDRVLSGENCVLALGGGTPTDIGCRKLLGVWQENGAARVLYLRAQPETLATRISPGDDRPSLTGGDPASEIGRVFDERDPLYRSLADGTIECDGLSVDELIDTVVRTATGLSR